MENQVGMPFKMPKGNTLYICGSRPLKEDESRNEYIDDLYYTICTEKIEYPESFTSFSCALMTAYGIQWGANNANI